MIMNAYNTNNTQYNKLCTTIEQEMKKKNGNNLHYCGGGEKENGRKYRKLKRSFF